LNAETRYEKFNGTFTLEAPNPLTKDEQQTSKLNITSVIGDHTCGFALGGEVDATVERVAIEKANLAVSYSINEFQFTTYLKKTLSAKPSTVVGLTAFHRPINGWKNLSLASEFTHTLNGASVISVGGQINPDNTSTFKSRLTSAGSLGVSYTQRCNAPLDITLGAEALKLFSGDNQITWSVKFSLK